MLSCVVALLDVRERRRDLRLERWLRRLGVPAVQLKSSWSADSSGKLDAKASIVMSDMARLCEGMCSVV